MGNRKNGSKKKRAGNTQVAVHNTTATINATVCIHQDTAWQKAVQNFRDDPFKVIGWAVGVVGGIVTTCKTVIEMIGHLRF